MIGVFVQRHSSGGPMATIVTVHGSFAHMGAPNGLLSSETQDAAGGQWWQKGGAFDLHLRQLVEAPDPGGKVDFVPFVWSAHNSETARREAARGLLKLLHSLDDKGERYSVVGHSHGGSVISAALIESLVQRRPLEGLKSWITVGTPFIAMKKEPFLFTRLNLMQRTLFVASAMLLMMFLFYAVGQIFDEEFSRRRIPWFMFGGLMMSIPFLFFYTALKIWDGRIYAAYKRKWIDRARETYAHLWTPLCHSADEAVQGLKAVPDVKLEIVERDFAASTLTMGSIFALPLIYLFVVTSPSIMLRIADFLKTDVYGVDQMAIETAKKQQVDEMDQLIKRLRERARYCGTVGSRCGQGARCTAGHRQGAPAHSRFAPVHGRELPEYPQYERAERYKRRFLIRNGVACENTTLCGGGEDFSVNTRLLYHVVTDELSALFLSDSGAPGPARFLVRIVVPMILVPLASGFVAVLILSAVGWVALRVSSALSRWLNDVTLAEVKRQAFGNDTEGEIAVKADRAPLWISPPPPYLPDELGDLIVDYSNSMTAQSLARFRKALSGLVLAGTEERPDLISAAFTWKELVHATYFDVPQFRVLIARAIGGADGFKPTQLFLQSPDFEKSGHWLAGLKPKVETKPA